MWRRESGPEACLNSRRRDVMGRWGAMMMPCLLGLKVVWGWEQGEEKSVGCRAVLKVDAIWYASPKVRPGAGDDLQTLELLPTQ